VTLRRTIGATVAALAAWLASAPVMADEPPKRDPPDYAGRPSPPPTPGEVALWVPRVIFSPVYFVSEYLIRRPLGALIIAAERANIPSVLYDFFAFGPEHKAGIVPTAFVDFGLNPSVGVYAFWDDAFFKGDDLRMHFSGWPGDWLGGSVVQRITFADKNSVTLGFSAVRRPDHPFYGLGPGSLESERSRYGADKVEGSAVATFPLWRASRIETGAGVRHVDFFDGHYGGDPGIVEQSRTGLFALPDGYASGYDVQFNRVSAALDSRRPFPEEGSGVRLEARAEQGNGFGPMPASGWLRYDAAVGGFLDLDGHRRVVSLSVQTLFADPIGSQPVPFTELVSLGGDRGAPMPGFLEGRLVDRSAAVASLRYRWPIGPWLDGSMQAAVGNVFGEHLDGFDVREGRLSAALGLETDGSPDSNFQFLIGFGTETFDHGGTIDSLRLAFGVTRGL
jgi:hypothetical protein